MPEGITLIYPTSRAGGIEGRIVLLEGGDGARVAARIIAAHVRIQSSIFFMFVRL